jgi:hypothetical protein
MRGNSRGTNRNIAAIDVTAAVPPGSLMNSRRFKGAPFGRPLHLTASLNWAQCFASRHDWPPLSALGHGNIEDAVKQHRNFRTSARLGRPWGHAISP